jgi:DNA-binding MarR family transcriptional regulator
LTNGTIRQLLDRRDLAAARYRSAASRRLGLGDSEMLAVAHLAQRGRLTPTEIAGLLDLSSGGVSALVQRLEEAGNVVREPHPTDGRSSVVRLSPAFVESARRVFGPLAADLDELSDELDDDQHRVIERFLVRVVDASEHHADRVHGKLHGGDDPGSTPVPTLWG